MECLVLQTTIINCRTQYNTSYSSNMSSDEESSTVSTARQASNPSPRSADGTRSLSESEIRAIFGRMTKADIAKYSSAGEELPGSVTIRARVEPVSAQTSVESWAEEKEKNGKIL